MCPELKSQSIDGRRLAILTPHDVRTKLRTIQRYNTEREVNMSQESYESYTQVPK